jgi:hypothetical protein
LAAYDSIYIVSCYSCAACVKGYCEQLQQPKRLLVLDTVCNKELFKSIGTHYVHHINQQTLDSVFGLFGNMVILKKSAAGYTQTKYPE